MFPALLALARPPVALELPPAPPVDVALPLLARVDWPPVADPPLALDVPVLLPLLATLPPAELPLLERVDDELPVLARLALPELARLDDPPPAVELPLPDRLVREEELPLPARLLFDDELPALFSLLPLEVEAVDEVEVEPDCVVVVLAFDEFPELFWLAVEAVLELDIDPEELVLELAELPAFVRLPPKAFDVDALLAVEVEPELSWLAELPALET